MPALPVGAIARRIRGRSTGTRRPPRLTEPAPCPCHTATRSASWRPFGPHSAITSSPMIAAITCSPAPTARACRPWRSSPASSPRPGQLTTTRPAHHDVGRRDHRRDGQPCPDWHRAGVEVVKIPPRCPPANSRPRSRQTPCPRLPWTVTPDRCRSRPCRRPPPPAHPLADRQRIEAAAAWLREVARPTRRRGGAGTVPICIAGPSTPSRPSGSSTTPAPTSFIAFAAPSPDVRGPAEENGQSGGCRPFRSRRSSVAPQMTAIE